MWWTVVPNIVWQAQCHICIGFAPAAFYHPNLIKQLPNLRIEHICTQISQRGELWLTKYCYEWGVLTEDPPTVCCEPVFSLIRAMTIIHCWNCFIDFNGLSYDGWANCPYFFTARTIFWGFGGLQKGSKQPRNAYVAISGSGSSKLATHGGSWLDLDRGHTCWYVGIFFPFWHCHQGAPKGLKTAPKCHK